MRLLILTPQFPYPPHQGTTLRNYNLIKNLAERHSIHLFSILAPGDDPSSGPVADLVEQIVTAPQPQRTTSDRLRDLVLSPLPDMALRLWSDGGFRAVARPLRSPRLRHPPGRGHRDGALPAGVAGDRPRLADRHLRRAQCRDLVAEASFPGGFAAAQPLARSRLLCRADEQIGTLRAPGAASRGWRGRHERCRCRRTQTPSPRHAPSQSCPMAST